MDKRIAALTVLVLAFSCSADVFTVDDDGVADFQTIQDAIDNSWHGDTIIVMPGTYEEQIVFGGRQITVRSEDPEDPNVVANTVIASDSDAGVLFEFGENEDSVLMGLTITGAGILCTGASPTLFGNVIRDCAGVGILGQSDARPTIVANQILDNAQEGILACDGLIQSNLLSGNTAGIASCTGSILDNTIAHSTAGGGLCSCTGEIARNLIVGNYVPTLGGGLYQCTGEVHHNVIAGNRADQQGGGLYGCTSPIYNNTIVGNRAGEAGGALSECPTAVYNNIIAFNKAPVGAGLYGEYTNTYNAFWSNSGGNFAGGAAAGTGDMSVNPRFASNGSWDDNGTTDANDDSWVNGDYHLQSEIGRWDANERSWVVDSQTSRCIDAGDPSSTWAAELWPHGRRINLGAYGGTAQASMSSSDAGLATDLDSDGSVGAPDLMLLAESWLTDEAPVAADLDRDGDVDSSDLAILALDWGTGPAGPPTPSPMTFATAPKATGPYSIAMVATKATSTDGTAVEYYFEDYYSPAYNSGWLSYKANEEPRWEDTGLSPLTRYTYRVKARNRGNRLATEWSEPLGAVTTQEDFTAPKPNPMTWQTEPYAVSATLVRMIATTAADISGVEYQFECTSDPNYSSDWQDSATCEIADLPDGYYTFRVWARDKSPYQNTTSASNEVSVDLLPPTPDPMEWASEPDEINGGGGTFDYYAAMTAVEASDDAGVEYFFQCTTESAFSSGWQSSPEYKVKVGRSGQQHRFRVKARDTSPSHNETGWSSLVVAR
ncbi:MAG: right-handed parallel beta-helix repeat-containing protein [Phycisphaerae bacterium]|nr:right-handed parallel beta-helix repeat-containing protein [Phycisphaerae bacterium]